MAERADVAIVGWGPVGQALAILVALRGRRVVAFEKQPVAYPLPRAVHFDHEVGRILQATGVAADLAPSVEPADAYEWRNGIGDVLLRFPSRAMGLSGWPEANMFAQPDLERLLDARARALPGVAVHRGHEVVGVTEDRGGATLTIQTAGGQRHDVPARFVVGCDGANSFVRQRLGATVTDLGFFFDWLIVDVVPHVPRVWRPLNVQICDPARPTTLVSGGRGRRRWEFMRLPGESVDDLNTEATAWRLLAPWDVTPATATLERHTVYRFQARWVDRWRRGPLLLAGDAAHQMPPFAGQGLCSGLRDAITLAWKLDLVLAGTAPESLLDTYAAERVAHVRAMIDFSMALGRVICVPDPAEAAARDAALMADAQRGQRQAPPSLGLTAGVLHDGDPLAGRLGLQAPIRRGDTTGLFDDVVGRGWTLLGATGDPAAVLDAEARAVFAALGGITAHLGAGSSLHDVTGAYRRWFDETGAAVVLQRPDFYLYGGAARLDGASDLVRALRASLDAGG
jgi:2-polyprenyl-6-methoxyphenol hydroxylase-like FAD-dependent oxidoreductase